MRWIPDSKSIRKMEQKHNERKAELKELVDSLFEKEPDDRFEHLASGASLISALSSSALAGNLFVNQQAALSGYGQQSGLQAQLAQNQAAAQQQSMQLGLGSLAGLGASLLGGSL